MRFSHQHFIPQKDDKDIIFLDLNVKKSESLFKFVS